MLVFAFSSISEIQAQTYVGEFKTSNGYQAVVLKADQDSIGLSFLDRSIKNQRIPLKLDPGVEFISSIGTTKYRWKLDSLNNNELKIKLKHNGQSQVIRLNREQGLSDNIDLKEFEGNYVDDQDNRAIAYVSRERLYLMSPYSKRKLKLFPIADSIFWAKSGERFTFEAGDKGEFDQLTIRSRNDQQSSLSRSFSFFIKEDWVLVDDDSIYINLFLPEKKGKLPACLLLPGGGGSSQMENFQYEARLLASHGMVAMTFDKASVGMSKGISFENYSFEEKADRYQKLFNYLRAQNKVNPQKTGIHGPSEGGRLALMIGAKLGGDVAFINATATPVMTLKEGQLYAINHYSRKLGMKEEEILSVLNLWNIYYEGIIAERIDTAIFFEIRRLREKYARAFLPPASSIIPVSPKKEDLQDNNLKEIAKDIKCNILLQYGEYDQRVNAYASVNNLLAAVNEEIEVETIFYDRGNHSMMNPKGEICSGYAYDKIEWLRTNNILP